jgi:hypothetical protein
MEDSMTIRTMAAPAAFILAFATLPANAGTVTALDGSQGWSISNTAAGASQLVDLTGLGGALESGQPLPTGAVKQTTTADNADKSLVAYGANFGLVGDILTDVSLSYSYYKSSGADNVFAAPTLKLAFYNPDYVGDGYGELIYEPSWQSGASIAPAADIWQTVTADFNTGLFWTTGMFGQLNSAGGPPLKTLAGWQAAFDNGFDGANLVSVGIGIGSYNQGQLNYFDNVTISGTNGPNGTYDFEMPAAVPLPAGLPFLLCALGGLGLMRRRKRT